MTKKRIHDPPGKRQAILAAATTLFAARGYEGTSIADIAGEADVAVGSVYRQFPDKPALLLALHLDMETELITVMRTAWDVERPYPDRFEPMFAALFSALTERHFMMRILAMTKELVAHDGSAPGTAMISAIRAMYRDGEAAGAFRPYPPETLAPILHGMVNGGLSAWAANPTPQTEKLVLQTLKDIAAAISNQNSANPAPTQSTSFLPRH